MIRLTYISPYFLSPNTYIQHAKKELRANTFILSSFLPTECLTSRYDILVRNDRLPQAKFKQYLQSIVKTAQLL